jgi:lipopolysaccharide transport system ATP-binding protein
MNDIAIDVKGISKKYAISVGYEPDNLREKLVEIVRFPIHILKGTHKTKKKIFWALKNISFQVKRGEVVGIIGKNGAGKSTLLKIISRITEPTDGTITMRGRVASMLEVGTGFNPELTGRENIYLNGSILGMTRKEIGTKVDEIIDFSGVRKFIDTPVKRYSSGMFVRLAFAVAAHLDADILLIDEVLAVGDQEFQKKSLAKINSLTTTQNKTVIFVSHSMPSILKLCNRCVYISEGKISMVTDNVKKVVEIYSGSDIANEVNFEWKGTASKSNDYFTASRFYITTDKGRPESIYSYNDQIKVHITGRIHKLHKVLQIGFAAFSAKTNELLFWNSFTDAPESEWPTIHKGNIHLSTLMPAKYLNEGSYRLELIAGLNKIEWFYQPENNAPKIYFQISGGLPIKSLWNSYKPGYFAPLTKWIVEKRLK